MKILFIGGTGTISTAVTERLARQGHDLYLLTRGQRAAAVPEGVHILRGDINDRDGTKALIRDLTFDSVVDWIAFRPEDIRRDIVLFQGRTRQYVFISTASAYQKPATDWLITESTPLANPYWEYSRLKIACENLLLETHRETGFPVTIVRPSHTYGNGSMPFTLNSSQAPWNLIYRLTNGMPVPVHGDGSSLWVMTHNSDFAKGIAGLLGNGRAIGHAFHITTDEAMSWNRILSEYGDALGVTPKPVHLSSRFICGFDPNLTGPLLGDKASCVVFDNSKIKRFVPEFQCTKPLRDGLRETIAWYSEHPEMQVPDPAHNEWIDRMIAAHDTACGR